MQAQTWGYNGKKEDSIWWPQRCWPNGQDWGELGRGVYSKYQDVTKKTLWACEIGEAQTGFVRGQFSPWQWDPRQPTYFSTTKHVFHMFHMVKQTSSNSNFPFAGLELITGGEGDLKYLTSTSVQSFCPPLSIYNLHFHQFQADIPKSKRKWNPNRIEELKLNVHDEWSSSKMIRLLIIISQALTRYQEQRITMKKRDDVMAYLWEWDFPRWSVEFEGAIEGE